MKNKEISSVTKKPHNSLKLSGFKVEYTIGIEDIIN